MGGGGKQAAECSCDGRFTTRGLSACGAKRGARRASSAGDSHQIVGELCQGTEEFLGSEGKPLVHPRRIRSDLSRHDQSIPNCRPRSIQAWPFIDSFSPLFLGLASAMRENSGALTRRRYRVAGCVPETPGQGTRPTTGCDGCLRWDGFSEKLSGVQGQRRGRRSSFGSGRWPSRAVGGRATLGRWPRLVSDRAFGPAVFQRAITESKCDPFRGRTNSAGASLHLWNGGSAERRQ